MTRFVLGIIMVIAGWAGLAAPVHARADGSPRVLFVLATDGPEDAYWYRDLDTHSRNAADALDMTVERLWAGLERPAILAAVEDRLQTEPVPDYIVFANQRGLGPRLLKLADAHGVDAFLYVAPLLDADWDALGGPRGELEHWIGELIPDDEQAGYDLATRLFKAARDRDGTDTPIRAVALHGRRATTSSSERAKGFRRAVADTPDVEFLQGVSARWSAETAALKYWRLRQRYGRIDVVWAANDPMAMGVVDSHMPGMALPVIGGVDWETPALDAIADGRLHTSMGGHVYDIAWVLALLKAHHEGRDFAERLGTASLTSRLSALDASDPDPELAHDAFARALRAVAADPARLGTPAFDHFEGLADADPATSPWGERLRETFMAPGAFR